MNSQITYSDHLTGNPIYSKKPQFPSPDFHPKSPCYTPYHSWLALQLFMAIFVHPVLHPQIDSELGRDLILLAYSRKILSFTT